MHPTPLHSPTGRPVSAHTLSHPEILLPEPGGYMGLKRTFDFFVALALLIVAAPVIVLTLLLVKLTSRGPALYSQIRLGKDARPFAIYKVRTMYQDAERISGAAWSKPGDSRITPLGRFLRKTHLDELPQLWNVLRGDMSMVGPRPERPEFVPQLEVAVPYYRVRLLVRPGVTGLAQVQLPPDTDLESVRVKLAYDIDYIRKVSFLFDVKICWATALHVAGIDFELIRRFFGFSIRERIEIAYRNLAGDYQRKKLTLKDPRRDETPSSLTLDALRS
jgi:lipopolysaccharide/colanic/teichoic acid biosynthesis glycosyltransferase